jgi:hypothetical protein
MIVAGEWYEFEPLQVWAGVVVTLVVGLLGAWVAWRAASPRRRLLYGVRSVTPLLTAPRGMRGDLEVRHKGELIRNPHVVELVLASRGRRDITSDMFDRDNPLRVHLGVNIVEPLQVRTDTRSAGRLPEITVEDHVVTMPPCRVGSRQRITVTLLVDGFRAERLRDSDTLRCESPLVDVQVRAFDPGTPWGAVGKWLTSDHPLAMMATSGAMVVGLTAVSALLVKAVGVGE